MKDRIFVDSNVFIYLIDRRDSFKTKMAVAFFKSIAESEINISTQVVKEFCQAAIKKFQFSEAEVLSNLAVFDQILIADTPKTIIEKAISLKFKHQLSFYDSVIVASALASNCDILYSEDMQHSQKIEGLQIINPFAN
ncbi:PIN domain-containing protein [Nonlabens antarcticus]|uniref:PIN domain-containing protein n=1 Tax=Nonlabens antarcticus TaxID=392714 RepID=UPI001891D3BC|nr:PIN domain-containing protein [Nonlabens antarcticus]